MASYQARGRDPLFDRNTQAVLERRGKELLGLALIGVGVLFALMLGSYVPEDPSWLSVTDAPVQNMLGRMGATIASPLMIVVGLASWGFAVVFAVWGLRFVLHRGEERALSRAVFAPIAIALVSVFASSYGTATQGLGGLFGDTALAGLLSLSPIDQALSLKLLTFLMLFAAICVSLFTLGVTREELRVAGRFLLFGVISLYAVVLHLMGRTAKGSVVAGQRLAAATAERRAARRIAAAQVAQDARLQADMIAQEPRSLPFPHLWCSALRMSHSPFPHNPITLYPKKIPMGRICPRRRRAKAFWVACLSVSRNLI